jgi:murein DD-endopeptidase MepM/ murein hydrolase activator NlpD
MAKLDYRIILFSFVLVIGASVHARSISKLQNKLQKYQVGIKKVRKEISSIDKMIKGKNKRLIDMMQKKTSIQNHIIEMEHGYQEDFEEYSKQKQEIVEKIKKIAIHQMNQMKNEDSFYKNVVMRKLLKKKLAKIKENELKLENIRNEIMSYQDRFQKVESFETELNLKIVALESRQQDYLQTYQKRMGKTSQISKMIKAELKKRDAFFAEPLEQYKKRTSNKKGVYYTVNSRQQVLAAKRGKVIYVGSMSNYGNVVMIQHANSKISVYLGKFAPKIRENSQVKQGEIIGYTDHSEQKQSNVYFEIRHNNIPQKTLPLIQKV